MNKKELIREVANSTNYTIKDVTVVTDALFEIIEDVVSSNEEVNICGFGKFIKKIRAGRNLKNPSNGSPMYVEPLATASFKLGVDFKRKVREYNND